jgi:hypothetical protein
MELILCLISEIIPVAGSLSSCLSCVAAVAAAVCSAAAKTIAAAGTNVQRYIR